MTDDRRASRDEPPPEWDLTIVVACVEARTSIDRCLASIAAACDGLLAQIVVIDASRDGTAGLVRDRWPRAEVHEHPPGTLIPRLWAAGWREARGRLVVFTIGHVVVGRGWARALVDGAAAAAGVGGPLTLAPDAGVVARAVYFLRYSAFMPSELPDGTVAGEIAGDNAGYTRAVLARHAASLSDGFWEVEFHRLLRADGEGLTATAAATASLVASTPLTGMIRHRFAHGRHFGARRVAHGAGRLRVAGAAPAVPFVLAWRAARRVRRVAEYRRPFVSALPVFMILAAAWAAGEAAGALAPS